MRNAMLDETQAGIKIAGGNINNLRYAYDTTLMAESKEELKSLLMIMSPQAQDSHDAALWSTQAHPEAPSPYSIFLAQTWKEASVTHRPQGPHRSSETASRATHSPP